MGRMNRSVQNLPSPRLLSKNLKIVIYKTKILPVVLYGCETLSPILREKYRMGVFENRVLRRIFGPKRDGMTGRWIKLHKEELHNLYSSPSIIRIMRSKVMKWTGLVPRLREDCLYAIGRTAGGEKPLGRQRFWWVYNIKVDLLDQIQLGGVDWIGLFSDRYRWRALVNAVMNLQLP
jgi:hypothetical protein